MTSQFKFASELGSNCMHLCWRHCPTTERFDLICGTSQAHDIIVRQVVWHGLRQPSHNPEQCRVELHEIGLM